MTRTISWFEFIWTLASAVGFIVNFRVFLGATIDLLVVKIRRINSIREYAAFTSVIMFGSWTFIQFIFLLVGVNAMTYGPVHHTGRQAIAATLFVTSSTVLAVTGVVVDRRRVALKKKIESFEE